MYPKRATEGVVWHSLVGMFVVVMFVVVMVCRRSTMIF
jgi:hypothetical protein